MSKPKNMTPEQEAAWLENYRQKDRESHRKCRKANPEKHREKNRKWAQKQSSALAFMQMTAAAAALSQQPTTNKNEY